MAKNDTIIIPMLCSVKKKKFYARYDLAFDKIWNLSYGLEEFPVDLSGRIGDSEGTMNIDAAHTRMGPQYKCPHCGNKSFVKCGRCNEYSCYSGTGTFSCAKCGASGEVSGTISEIGGSSRTSQG